MSAEALGVPHAREITGGKRRSLTAVVPAAERGDQDGPLERRTADHPQLTHGVSVRRGVRHRAVTRPTVQAQTAAARRDMDQHEPPRQLVPVLKLADASSARAAARGARPRPERARRHALGSARASRAGAGSVIPNAAVARTWSQTASSRFQKRLISALSPGCGPAAVESVPVTTRIPHAPARTSPASLSHSGAGDSTRPRGIAPRLDRDHHRAGEHDEREQEVRRDHQRVQVEPDRQEAERSLRDRAEEDQRRRPHHPAAEPGRLPARRSR